MNKRVLVLVIGAVFLLFAWHKISPKISPVSVPKSNLATEKQYIYNFSIKSLGELNLEQNIKLETNIKGSIAVITQGEYLIFSWTPNISIELNNKSLPTSELENVLKSVSSFSLRLSGEKPISLNLYTNLDPNNPNTTPAVNFLRMIAMSFYWRNDFLSQNFCFDYFGPCLITELKGDDRFMTKSTNSKDAYVKQDSAFQVKHDEMGKILNLSQRQESVLSFADKKLGKNLIQISLDFLRNEVAPAQAPGNFSWNPFMSPSGLNQYKNQLQRKYAGWDLKRVKDQFIKLKLSGAKNASDYAKASTALQELLFSNPSLAQEYGNYVNSLDPADPMYAEILRALSFVGSPECQKALINHFFIAKKNVVRGNNLLVALGFVQNPTLESQEFLESLSQSADAPFRKTAQLMLGNMAYNLQTSDPTRSNDLHSKLLEKITTAKSREELLHALAVWGNTGSCESVDQIIVLTRNVDLDIAKAALLGLRFCSLPPVNNLYVVELFGRKDFTDTILSAIEMRCQRGLCDQGFLKLLDRELTKMPDALERQQTERIKHLLENYRAS